MYGDVGSRGVRDGECERPAKINSLSLRTREKISFVVVRLRQKIGQWRQCVETNHTISAVGMVSRFGYAPLGVGRDNTDGAEEKKNPPLCPSRNPSTRQGTYHPACAASLQ